MEMAEGDQQKSDTSLQTRQFQLVPLHRSAINAELLCGARGPYAAGSQSIGAAAATNSGPASGTLTTVLCSITGR